MQPDPRRLQGQDRQALQIAVEQVVLAPSGTTELQHLVSLRDRAEALLRTRFAPRAGAAASAQPAPRQLAVLAYIVRQSRGVPPTYREIGDALGIASTNGVAEHVKALLKKGLLRQLRQSQARALLPTEAGRRAVREHECALRIAAAQVPTNQPVQAPKAVSVANR